MSRMACSAGALLLMVFCLIFVPYGHCDEPENSLMKNTQSVPKALTADRSMERMFHFEQCQNVTHDTRFKPPADGSFQFETRCLDVATSRPQDQ